MFHIDLSSKRARLALRFFTYGVMTLATVLLTTIAVFFAMGYRFNQNGFAQGGLVKISTTPEGAQVIVDGTLQNVTTPALLNFSAGTHTVEMRRQGYLPWQKTIDLAAGQVLWLNYVRLFPESITTTAVASFNNVAGAVASPDRKWMVVQPQHDQVAVTLVSFANAKKPTVSDLTIPEAAFTKKDGSVGTFRLLGWDATSRYLLVAHDVGEIHEYLRLDRQNATKAINISRTFNLTITDLQFAGTNADVVYAKADGALRMIDVRDTVAAPPFIEGVDTFQVYRNDTIAFSATRPTNGASSGRQTVAGIYAQGKETVVRTFATVTPVHVAYTEYSRHAYLALESADGYIDLLRDPVQADATKDNPIRLHVGDAVDWFAFNDNGRMLAAARGSSMTNYDIELQKVSNWTFSGAIPPTRPLQWFDDYTLGTDAGGRIRLFEFDGMNGRDVTDVAEGLPIMLSAEEDNIFSFVKTAGSYNLQSSKLTQ